MKVEAEVSTPVNRPVHIARRRRQIKRLIGKYTWGETKLLTPATRPAVEVTNLIQEDPR